MVTDMRALGSNWLASWPPRDQQQVGREAAHDRRDDAVHRLAVADVAGARAAARR